MNAFIRERALVNTANAVAAAIEDGLNQHVIDGRVEQLVISWMLAGVSA